MINRTTGGWTWYNKSKQEVEMNLDLLSFMELIAEQRMIIWPG